MAACRALSAVSAAMSCVSVWVLMVLPPSVVRRPRGRPAPRSARRAGLPSTGSGLPRSPPRADTGRRPRVADVPFLPEVAHGRTGLGSRAVLPDLAGARRGGGAVVAAHPARHDDRDDAVQRPRPRPPGALPHAAQQAAA